MLALVMWLEGGKLGCLECGVVGGIYNPNHQTSRLVEAAVAWRTGQSGAPPDSPVRHRTLSDAPATSPGRCVPTVGALTCGPAWLSGGAPDKPCRLSGVPPARALTFARAGAHLMRLQSTVGAK
jgi:hypothetical protein